MKMETSQFDSKKEMVYSKEQPAEGGLGETGKIRQHRRHDIIRTLAGSAMVIAAALANVGCEKKAEEPIYTEGRKIENQKVEEPRPAPAPAALAQAPRLLTKEEQLRMLGGDNEAAQAAPAPAPEPVAEPAPPAPAAPTPQEIFAAEKKRQGGDPTAPAIKEVSATSFYYYNASGENEFGNTWFYRAEPFEEGIALVSDRSDAPYYFINRNGVNAFGDKKFKEVSPFVDGLAVVKEYNKELCYFMNRKGKNAFDDDQEFLWAQPFSEGLAVVSIERGRFFMNKEGRNEFGGNGFELAYSFSEGLAVVYNGEKWHYINKKGVNAFGGKEFDDAISFKGGYAKVKEGLRSYVINKSGEEVQGR